MKTLRIHYFQHVPFEGIGHIETWAKKNAHTISSTKFFNNQPLPNLNKIDWLIIMGGPMSVHDENEHPWLILEKQFIKEAIEAEKVVIGFCLGGQLIAHTLGGKVTKNKHKEIGWYPISFSDLAKKTSIFEGLRDIPVFHWHNDTFEIPNGGTLIASSEACTNQAFMYNEKVFAFQFHLETELASLRGMIENCPDDYAKEDKFVQKAYEMVNKENINENNQLLELIFNNIASRQ